MSVAQQPVGLHSGRTVRARAPHRVHGECHERHHRQRDGPSRERAGRGRRRGDRGQRVTLVMILGAGQRGEHIWHLGEVDRCSRGARGSSGRVPRCGALQDRHQHDRDDQQGPQHHRCHAEARARRCASTARCHHFTVHLHPIPVVGIREGAKPALPGHGQRAATRPPRRRYAAGSRESFPATESRQPASTAQA